MLLLLSRAYKAAKLDGSSSNSTKITLPLTSSIRVNPHQLLLILLHICQRASQEWPLLTLSGKQKMADWSQKSASSNTHLMIALTRNLNSPTQTT